MNGREFVERLEKMLNKTKTYKEGIFTVKRFLETLDVSKLKGKALSLRNELRKWLESEIHDVLIRYEEGVMTMRERDFVNFVLATHHNSTLLLRLAYKKAIYLKTIWCDWKNSYEMCLRIEEVE